MTRYSMTGYGEATQELPTFSVTLTLQTLNSKNLDIIVNAPQVLTQQIVHWRKSITNKIVRGRVELCVTLQSRTSPLPLHISPDRIKQTYHYLQSLAHDLGGAQSDLLKLTFELLSSQKQDLSLGTQEKQAIQQLFDQALQECLRTRALEGSNLIQQVQDCLAQLEQNLHKITSYAPQRKEKLRKRLQEKIQVREGAVDENRWEQEVLYYLEKIDIEEECVRLQSHIDYMRDMLEQTEPLGRRLAFILQEMLREVNTISAKAQDVNLQHLAVGSKQCLEQIREQGRNLL